WGLYALTGIYEATWDPRYLEAARAAATRLIDHLDARGKFDIRWDNRISFFNGIAASGLLRVADQTGDERLRDGVLRVLSRTFGLYPEYAGRTLDSLAWAYERTGDPRYRVAALRTWETTMERSTRLDKGWDAGVEIFAWRYRPPRAEWTAA